MEWSGRVALPGSGCGQFAAVGAGAGSGGNSNQCERKRNRGPEAGRAVESLLRSMTLEEKIGQLVRTRRPGDWAGTGRTDYKDMIAGDRLGVAERH